MLTQNLHWFPPSGRLSVDMQATHVTGFFVLDGILTRELAGPDGWVLHPDGSYTRQGEAEIA